MAAQNGDVRHRQANNNLPNGANKAILAGKHDIAIADNEEAKSSANTVNLLICVGGIYASL